MRVKRRKLQNQDSNDSFPTGSADEVITSGGAGNTQTVSLSTLQDLNVVSHLDSFEHFENGVQQSSSSSQEENGIKQTGKGMKRR